MQAKHVKILGRKACPALLDSPGAIDRLIRNVIRIVGMTLLGEPQLHRVELEVEKLGREPFEDEGGISCLACLSTSHVAIHTWPLRGEFHFDLYSCRSFELQSLVDLLQQGLGAAELKVTDLSHAVDWGDSEGTKPAQPLRLPPLQVQLQPHRLASRRVHFTPALG